MMDRYRLSPHWQNVKYWWLVVISLLVVLFLWEFRHRREFYSCLVIGQPRGPPILNLLSPFQDNVADPCSNSTTLSLTNLLMHIWSSPIQTDTTNTYLFNMPISSNHHFQYQNIQTTIRYFQQSVDAISILLTIIFIFKDSEDLFFWIVDTFNLSVDKIIDIILLNMLDQVQTPSWGLFSFVENRIRAQTLRIIRSIFNFWIEISLGWVLFLFETTQVKVFPLYVISFFTLLNMKFGVLYNI